MRFQAEIRYSRPPTAVNAMMADPAFQDRKCRDTGALSHSVDVDERDGHLVITCERKMPTDQFPDFVKSFVGGSLTLLQVDDWAPPAADGSRSGLTSLTVPGTPLSMTGTARLASADGGAVTTLDADIKAAVPFVGGRIEKAAGPAILAGVRQEQKTAQAWFDGQARADGR
ncbi:MAG: DUF2505 domain-containing protein [bacterium]